MSLRALDYPVVRVLSWSERRLGPLHEQQCALCRKPRGLGMVPGNLATVRNVGRRHLRPGWPRSREPTPKMGDIHRVFFLPACPGW